MKSIAPKLFAVMIVLGTSNAVYISINLHGEAGVEFTNPSASFGAGEPGMTFSTQRARSGNDGDNVGLGMDYSFNLGPFLITLGGKNVYLNPKDSDEGCAIAAGDGAELPLGQCFTPFGEGYYSPDSMPSGVDSYVEANAGLRTNVLPSLNIETGYRYVDMAEEDGNCDNTFADGACAGVNFRF